MDKCSLHTQNRKIQSEKPRHLTDLSHKNPDHDLHVCAQTTRINEPRNSVCVCVCEILSVSSFAIVMRY
jgi:hypothetical protein